MFACWEQISASGEKMYHDAYTLQKVEPEHLSSFNFAAGMVPFLLNLIQDVRTRALNLDNRENATDSPEPNWKKRSERRKHCAPKIFAPPQTPFPGAQDRRNLLQLEMVTTCTYIPSLVEIDARNFELSW